MFTSDATNQAYLENQKKIKVTRKDANLYISFPDYCGSTHRGDVITGQSIKILLHYVRKKL